MRCSSPFGLVFFIHLFIPERYIIVLFNKISDMKEYYDSCVNRLFEAKILMYSLNSN
jgi:hypothetical protein